MSAARITYRRIKGDSPRFLAWLGLLGLMIAVGLASA
jgi:hypothetical protein